MKLSLGNRGGEVEDGTVGEQRRKLLHYHLQKGVACRWFEALKTDLVVDLLGEIFEQDGPWNSLEPKFRRPAIGQRQMDRSGGAARCPTGRDSRVSPGGTGLLLAGAT